MNIYETFNNLRYHYENEVVEFKKAEYSMHKGLEYKKCKALLQDALEDHKFLTREEIDKLWWNLLSDVLSDKQKKTKVGNMLTKMREERIIVNETKGNVSVWSLLKKIRAI